MPSEKFPARVREIVSASGLRVDYFSEDSNAFRYAEANPKTHDLCRQYLSLAEHEALLNSARAEARREALIGAQKMLLDQRLDISPNTYERLYNELELHIKAAAQSGHSGEARPSELREEEGE